MDLRLNKYRIEAYSEIDIWCLNKQNIRTSPPTDDEKANLTKEEIQEIYWLWSTGLRQSSYKIEIIEKSEDNEPTHYRATNNNYPRIMDLILTDDVWKVSSKMDGILKYDEFKDIDVTLEIKHEFEWLKYFFTFCGRAEPTYF